VINWIIPDQRPNSLAFFFNAILIALTINIAASLM
jgi:uncharacterized membrane protein